jgi:hypothetical protein
MDELQGAPQFDVSPSSLTLSASPLAAQLQAQFGQATEPLFVLTQPNTNTPSYLLSNMKVYLGGPSSSVNKQCSLNQITSTWIVCTPTFSMGFTLFSLWSVFSFFLLFRHGKAWRCLSQPIQSKMYTHLKKAFVLRFHQSLFVCVCIHRGDVCFATATAIPSGVTSPLPSGDVAVNLPFWLWDVTSLVAAPSSDTYSYPYEPKFNALVGCQVTHQHGSQCVCVRVCVCVALHLSVRLVSAAKPSLVYT